jgi:hypothetical protein
MKAQLVTRPEGVTTGTDGRPERNILGEAHTFAGLMCIRRYEGSVCNPTRTGRDCLATGPKNVLGEAQTLSDLMAIGRYREEVSQRPARTKTWLGNQRNKPRILEICDLVAVNFPGLMPISEYRGPGRRSLDPELKL